MADEPDLTARLRGVAGRAKATPSRIEWLYANQEAVNESLRQLIAAVGDIAARLERLEAAGGGTSVDERLARLDQDNRAGVTALADEIHDLRGRLESSTRHLDGAIAGQASLLQRSVAAPAREAELARLLGELGASPPVRPGLSVLVACWNHGGYLADAIGSALATLDLLDPTLHGQVIVLDDASSDETPHVAAGAAAADGRVRVIRSGANLGLSRARSALLHVVPTSHALQLDADNLAAPAGVAALFDVARRTGSAFTYGTIVQQDADGQAIRVMSNEPLGAAWFASNYIDSLGVIDVEQLRGVGGYPVDPAWEPMEDWALLHRLARAGRLVGFVPVLAGRYRVLGSGLNQMAGDPRIGPERVVRTFNVDGRLTADTVAAFAAHPVLGPLWATPAALALNPALAPPPPAVPAPAPATPRLLVIGPGGVHNLGDDAIVVSALAQIRRHLPDHAIDLVTDGAALPVLDPAVRWLGTVSEAVWGLRDADLPADADLAATRGRIPSAAWPIRTVDPAAYAGAAFLGGGSLTSLWGDTLIAPRAVLAAAFQQAGVPYVVSGQGLGPLDERDRSLVSAIVAGAVAATVRDRASADEVTVDPGPTLTGDDALLLPPTSPVELAGVLESVGVAGPYVAVTVRDADYVGASGNELAAWAAVVDAVATERGAVVLGVALNDQEPTPELVTLERLAADPARTATWRLVSCDDDPALLAALMGSATAVAAHSYHAALFGLRAGVPTVLAAANPYYVAKATGLAERAGIDPALLVVTPDRIAELPQRLTALATTMPASPLDEAARSVDAWWPEALAQLAAAAPRRH